MKVKSTTILVFIVIHTLLTLTACFSSSEVTVTSGYGDVEPPHYTQESELIAYLEKNEGIYGESLYGDIDGYYKPEVVPDILTFAYIRPQNVYIGWNYNYSNMEATYGYFEWTAEKAGQERLEFCIENESLNRLENTDYYYSIIQTDAYPGIEAIFSVRWVMDDYIFHMNIPSDYVVKEGQPDVAAIKKYTQLKKIEINNAN